MKIIPQNITWKVARNNNQYAIIDTGQQKHTYWIKQNIAKSEIDKLLVIKK